MICVNPQSLGGTKLWISSSHYTDFEERDASGLVSLYIRRHRASDLLHRPRHFLPHTQRNPDAGLVVGRSAKLPPFRIGGLRPLHELRITLMLFEDVHVCEMALRRILQPPRLNPRGARRLAQPGTALRMLLPKDRVPLVQQLFELRQVGVADEGRQTSRRTSRPLENGRGIGR